MWCLELLGCTVWDQAAGSSALCVPRSYMYYLGLELVLPLPSSVHQFPREHPLNTALFHACVSVKHLLLLTFWAVLFQLPLVNVLTGYQMYSFECPLLAFPLLIYALCPF